MQAALLDCVATPMFNRALSGQSSVSDIEIRSQEIRSQELAKVMAPYGIEIGNSIDEVFVRVDTDASGSIGYDEFKAFMPVRQAASPI